MHEWHIRQRHGRAVGLCAHIKELLEAEGRLKRSVLQACNRATPLKVERRIVRLSL
jgi:hypothetical protein